MSDDTTPWITSTNCTSGACVQVRRHGDHIQLRNSQHPNDRILEFTQDEWDAFTQGVDIGEFRFHD